MAAGDQFDLGAHSGEVKEMRQESTFEPSSILGYLDGLDNLIW